MKIKPHTVHHATEDLRAQPVDGVHPERRRRIFKEHLLWKQQKESTGLREEAASEKTQNKNTDFMIFLNRYTKRSCSNPGSVVVVVENCPSKKKKKAKRGEPLLPFSGFLNSPQRFWVSAVTGKSSIKAKAAVSQGVVTVSKCAEAREGLKKKYFRPRVWNECCGSKNIRLP